MKSLKIDGAFVVSTTELGERLGVHLSSSRIKSLARVSPMVETSTGVYWREEHIPIIAMALANHFSQRAIDLQLVQNLDAVTTWNNHQPA